MNEMGTLLTQGVTLKYNKEIKEMVTIKETTNKSLTIKDAYMDGNTLCDDDGAEINIQELL